MKRALLSLTAIIIAGSQALAAGTPNSFITPQSPFRGAVNLTPTQNQNQFYAAYTGGANGSKCNSIVVSSNDTVGHNVYWRTYNGTAILFGGAAAAVAASAGYVTAPIQPLMNPTITPGFPVDQYGNQYIILGSGDTLTFAYNSTMTTGTAVFAFAQCSDF